MDEAEDSDQWEVGKNETGQADRVKWINTIHIKS